MRFPLFLLWQPEAASASAGLMEGVTTRMPGGVITYRQTNMCRIAPAPWRSEVGRWGLRVRADRCCSFRKHHLRAEIKTRWFSFALMSFWLCPAGKWISGTVIAATTVCAFVSQRVCVRLYVCEARCPVRALVFKQTQVFASRKAAWSPLLWSN